MSFLSLLEDMKEAGVIRHSVMILASLVRVVF